MLDVHIREKRFQAADGSTLIAVKDLAFTAAEAEFVCLLGPSGCGKTTTLRAILGLETDYDGRISLPSPEGRLGVVFQEPRLLPWRSVEENVRLAMPAERREQDLDELFDILGLSDMRSFFPAELSLGLARRAAMARAFAVEPSLLLLDEPFVSLDEETAARLRQLLITVWQARPTTVLMVTHSLREALELADRIVLLTPRPGKVRGIVEIGEDRSRRDPAFLQRKLDEVATAYPGLV